MIERKEYLENLIRFKDKQIIKVITGIRRCGKSTLFEIYQDYLLQNNALYVTALFSTKSDVMI